MRLVLKLLRFALLGTAGLVVLALGVFYIGAQDTARPGGEPLERLALQGFHLIDVETGMLRTDQTVLIDEGKITAVGPVADIAVPEGMRIVAGNGRYLSPGFWDMHTHVVTPGNEYSVLPTMVANGILYTRDMNGDCAGDECIVAASADMSRRLRRRIEEGRQLGPRLMAISSFQIRGPARRHSIPRAKKPAFLFPQDREDGRLLARYIQGRGVDLAKTYDSIPREAYFGLMAEAGRLDLTVGGHLPKAVSLMEAIDAGQKSLEHARVLPLACSTVADDFHALYARWTELEGEAADSFDEQHPKLRIKGRYKEVLAGFDAERCDRILSAMADAGMVYVPTHLTRQADMLLQDRPYTGDQRAGYVPALIRAAVWDPEAAEQEALYDERPELLPLYRQFFDAGLALTGRAHALGVRVLVGTDTGDILIYPGFSFHDEMALLARAGLSNADILRAATLSAAEHLGVSDRLGSIAPGKDADLIILQQNPLEDIAHTQSLDGLYYQQRLYDRGDLDRVLAAARDKANGLRHLVTFGWIAVTRLIPFVVQTGGDDAPGHSHRHG